MTSLFMLWFVVVILIPAPLRLLQLHLPHHYLDILFRIYDTVCRRVSDMRGVSASIIAELLVALPSCCVQASGSQSIGSRTS